jgi:hypothetical protein
MEDLRHADLAAIKLKTAIDKMTPNQKHFSAWAGSNGGESVRLMIDDLNAVLHGYAAQYAEIKRRESEEQVVEGRAEISPQEVSTLNALHREKVKLELLERMWGVLANAGGGDWERESEEWREAAAAVRDEYNALLAENYKPNPYLPEGYAEQLENLSLDHCKSLVIGLRGQLTQVHDLLSALQRQHNDLYAQNQRLQRRVNSTPV